MSKTRHWKPGESGTEVPAASKPDVAPAPRASVPPAPQLLSTMMLIDDDEDLLALWTLGLNAAGVEVVSHTNAEAAMADPELWEVDLLVTDLDLPGVNGPSFIRRVREANPKLPILAVTGSRDRGLITDAYMAGAYDCLLKPAAASQILARGVRGKSEPGPTGRLGVTIEGTPYLIDTILGEGGAATVYAGIHLDLGRRVAIKLSTLGNSAAARKQVLAEARVLESLRSRHVPEVLDFRELEDGRAMYVMEFVDGETLHALQRRCGPLPLEEALPLMGQVLDGVAFAHAKGLAHQDLKPENLIVTQSAEGERLVKILDFGLANVAGEGAAGFTPGWAAPEQVRGEGSDARADVFNLGLLLESMLTGLTPKVDRAFSAARLPAELNDQQLEALAWWIEKCRRAEPERRFENAGKAREALGQAFSYFAKQSG